MLTEEQKTHFHSLGFVKVPGALTPQEVDEFARRFDAAINSVQEDPSAAGTRIFPDGHRVIVPLLEADPYFYSVLDHPVLAAIGEDLLGEDCIFPGVSDGQIHSGNTNWHQDGSWPMPGIRAKFTFYMDDVGPGRGCLSFIPGSHLWPEHYNELERRVDERVLGYAMPDFPGRYDLPADKGDVIAFHTRIWHSSWGGGANRRQMAWMLQTRPRMSWEIERIVEGYKGYAQQWSPQTGRLVSDRFYETAGPRRMKKIKLLQEHSL